MTAKKAKRTSTPKKRAKPGQSKGAAAQRMKVFVEAYLSNNGNATQAALDAGFSPKSAASQGSRLLKNVKVQQELDRRRAELVTKYQITSDMVIRSIAQELTFDPAKLYGADGQLLPITQLPEDVRMALTSVEFEQAGSPQAPVFVRKVKWAQRQGAREQAMKHLGMFGKDNQQRTDPLTMLLAELQKTRSALPVVEDPE